MKPFRYLLILLLALASCSGRVADEEVYVFTSFHEPADEGLRFLYSRDGLSWDSVPGVWLRPTVGAKVMRDPSIVRGPDGLFRLVWTLAWRGDTGFGYAASADLMNWTEPRRIPAMDSIASTQNVWAPELFYDEVEGQYLIVFAACVPDAQFELGEEEVNNNHRLYCITTADFETFSAPALFYDPGFSCIDATLLKRGDGDYVMVFKDNTRPERNIRVAFAKAAGGPYGEPSPAPTEPFTEGPAVCRVGDEYYIYYDAYRRGDYGAMKTTDFRTFVGATDSVRVPHGHKHGTIFKAPMSVVERMLIR